jgi:protein O-GlcNAc transferase
LDADARRETIAQYLRDAKRELDENDLDQAERLCREALRLDPNCPPVLSCLSEVNLRTGRIGIALALISRAVALDPGSPWYHAAQSATLRLGGRAVEAEAAIRRALDIAPEQPGFWASLGMALHDQGRLTEAHESLLKGIELEPSQSREMQAALGLVHSSAGRPMDALACFRRAVEISPDDACTDASVLFLNHYSRDMTPEQLLSEARGWAARHTSQLTSPTSEHSNVRDPDRRLRIGYVSGDFRQHPVGSMLKAVLASHDRASTEVYCYSNHWKHDLVTEALRSHVDHWRSIVHMTDECAADLIRADAIDVLIDLSGHTAQSRTLMLARKPAPVQALWLGYFDTTGLPAVDYIIGDRFVCPPGDEGLYVERVARLPHSWFCYSPSEEGPDISPLPALSNGYVTFGCLNNLSKVNEDVIDLWAKILRAIPDARLHLKATALSDTRVRDELTGRFAAAGVDPERVACSGGSTYQEHLAAYNQIDIALDPFPYNGGATTLDALWMGTPVITLRGDRFVGRMGASVLAVTGLPELIAESKDEYVQRAIATAADLERLAELRASLRDRLVESPLCDGPGMALDLEHLYRQMWRTWCAGRPNASRHADLVGAAR